MPWLWLGSSHSPSLAPYSVQHRYHFSLDRKTLLALSSLVIVQLFLSGQEPVYSHTCYCGVVASGFTRHCSLPDFTSLHQLLHGFTTTTLSLPSLAATPVLQLASLSRNHTLYHSGSHLKPSTCHFLPGRQLSLFIFLSACRSLVSQRADASKLCATMSGTLAWLKWKEELGIAPDGREYSPPLSTTANHKREHSPDDDERKPDKKRTMQRRSCAICDKDRAINQFPNKRKVSSHGHASDVCRACYRQHVDAMVDTMVDGQIACPMCPEKLTPKEIESFLAEESLQKYELALQLF